LEFHDQSLGWTGTAGLALSSFIFRFIQSAASRAYSIAWPLFRVFLLNLSSILFHFPCLSVAIESFALGYRCLNRILSPTPVARILPELDVAIIHQIREHGLPPALESLLTQAELLLPIVEPRSLSIEALNLGRQVVYAPVELRLPLVQLLQRCIHIKLLLIQQLVPLFERGLKLHQLLLFLFDEVELVLQILHLVGHLILEAFFVLVVLLGHGCDFLDLLDVVSHQMLDVFVPCSRLRKLFFHLLLALRLLLLGVLQSNRVLLSLELKGFPFIAKLFLPIVQLLLLHVHLLLLVQHALQEAILLLQIFLVQVVDVLVVRFQC